MDRLDPAEFGFDIQHDGLSRSIGRDEYIALIRRAYDRRRPKGFDSENFRVKNPLSGVTSGERRTFTWRVFDHYRHKGYMSAADTAQLVREYEPLLEEPNLFLEFAELYSSIDDPETYSLASILWIRNYGLLGLHPSDELLQMPGSNAVIPQQEYENLAPSIPLSKMKRGLSLYEKYEDRGGPEESSDLFRTEVIRAGISLNLYKAALSKNIKKLQELLDIEGYSQRVPETRELVEQKILTKKGSASYVDVLVDMATRHVSTNIQSVLCKFAYPCISTDLSDPYAEDAPRSPQSLTASLWPRNLLGAMYLQFYWMITSGSELTYCRHCDAPISYAPTMPGSGKRKTYKNKEFCSKQCRQNYDYHHRRKHRRNDS